MSVSTEPATVFRYDQRRYFTKHAAFRAWAKNLVCAEYNGVPWCQCERGSYEETGASADCDFHADPEAGAYVEALTSYLMATTKL